MKVIIRVETIADWAETDIVELCQFERPIGELAPPFDQPASGPGLRLLRPSRPCPTGSPAMDGSQSSFDSDECRWSRKRVARNERPCRELISATTSASGNCHSS